MWAPRSGYCRCYSLLQMLLCVARPSPPHQVESDEPHDAAAGLQDCRLRFQQRVGARVRAQRKNLRAKEVGQGEGVRTGTARNVGGGSASSAKI